MHAEFLDSWITSVPHFFVRNGNFVRRELGLADLNAFTVCDLSDIWPGMLRL